MLQKSSMWRVLNCFFERPTQKHYVKDISRRIQIAHTSVKKNLDLLVRDRLIVESVEIRGKRRFPLYVADRNSPQFKQYKQVSNLLMLYDSGLIIFIKEKLAPRCIVLFGSYQHGEDVEDSDIDIFVECKAEDLDMDRFEKKLHRNTQLHFNSDFSTYSSELKNNIINGTVLSGYLKGYK